MSSHKNTEYRRALKGGENNYEQLQGRRWLSREKTGKQTLPHQLAVVAHEECYAPGCLDSPMSTRHFATIKQNE